MKTWSANIVRSMLILLLITRAQNGLLHGIQTGIKRKKKKKKKRRTETMYPNIGFPYEILGPRISWFVCHAWNIIYTSRNS